MTSAKPGQKASFLNALRRFAFSAWLFPVLLLIPLFGLTVLGISGSSIGVYYPVLVGPGKDPNLLFGKPRSIRSDEYVVNTQLTIAQKNDNYARINPNIGNGEDVSVLADAPYKDWSVLFKPHNLAFFVMPFDNAFAFRWWIMAYLLLVSCYCFILTLLPSKRLLAAGLSLAFLYSPFVQWWYLYGTLGAFYYSLFGGTVFIKLMREKSTFRAALWGLLLAYIAACFALILYPPFQVPAALVMLVFAIGYLVEARTDMPPPAMFKRLGMVLGAVAVSGAIALLFLQTRANVVHTIQNTAYPGKRLVQSGGYDEAQLLSGNLDFPLQFDHIAAHYVIPNTPINNQSEDSSFLFLWPFLLLPSFLLLLNDYKKGRFKDWSLLFVNILFLVLSAWMFVPRLNFIGKITFLDLVPHNRLVIGLGVLGLIQLVLLIRRAAPAKKSRLTGVAILAYSLLVLLAEILLDLYAKGRFPGYIGYYKAIAFALPIPVIIYLFLHKRFRLAVAGILAFSLFMSIGINPLYRGTAILTSGKVISMMKAAAKNDPKGRWIVEDGSMENFASMSGLHSLSGVYTYPQLSLWKPLDPQGKQSYMYNRYAHVVVNLYRDTAQDLPTTLVLPTEDHFGVHTEACSSFLKNIGVKFALVEVPLPAGHRCYKLVAATSTPERNFYVYELD